MFGSVASICRSRVRPPSWSILFAFEFHFFDFLILEYFFAAARAQAILDVTRP